TRAARRASMPLSAAILSVTAGPLASLVRARRRPLVRASSHSGTPRARSSTAEQGTFNPLVPGSNPGGLTRERGSRRRAVGVRGSESFHEVISNSRAGRLARLLAVRAPHTRKSSSSGPRELPRVTDEIAQHRTEQSFVGLDLQAIFDANAYGPGRRLPRVLSRDLARERAQVDRFAAKLGA